MDTEMMEDSTEDSLLSALLKDGGFEILTSTSQALLDQTLKDGILHNVPIVKNLVALGQMGVGLSERLFVVKIIRFLTSLKEVSESERKTFLQKLDNDRRTKKRVSEALLLSLSRMDDLEKPMLMANAFGAYIGVY